MNLDGLITFLDALPNPVTLNRKTIDSNGNIYDSILYTNHEFRRIIGYTPEDIPTDLAWFSTAYPDKEYQTFIMQEWGKALEHAKNRQSSLLGFPAKVMCKDRRQRWFNVMTHLDYQIGGEYKIITFVEITAPDQNRMERDTALLELTREKEFLKTLINILPIRIFWKDLKSRYLGCNNLFANDANLPDENQIIGKTDFEMPWHGQAELYEKDDAAVMGTGEKRINYIEPQSHTDGSMIILQTSKVPIVNLAGETVGILGTYSDITEEQKRKDELKASKEAFETIFQKANDPVLLIEDERFIDCNDAALKILGAASKEEVINTLPGDLSPECQPDGQNSYEKSHEATGKAMREGSNHFEWAHQRFDGQTFIVDVVLTRIVINSREIVHVAWRDITEETRLREAEHIRFERNKLYQKSLFEWSKIDHENVHTAIRKAIEISANTLEVDRTSVWLFNEAGDTLICSNLYIKQQESHTDGYLLSESDFPNYFSNLKHGHLMAIEDARNDPRTSEFTQNYLIPNTIFSMLDIPIVQAGKVLGVLCHEEVGSIRSWDTAEQEFAMAMASTIALSLEIQKRKQAEEQLAYKATHDDLTALPNRGLFLDRLGQAIKRAERDRTLIAVLFIDLDHFKEINDSLGHKTGDLVLIEMAKRLLKTIRNADTMARLGGDEFTVILDNILDALDIHEITEKLLDSIKMPILIEEHEFYLTGSIGVSLYPHDGDTPEALLRNADTAMYRAKREGRNGYRYYTQEMTEKAFERVRMETHLRRAIEREEFVVYYQPQIDGISETTVGMEALIRWNHPEMGIVSPAKFIPLAEETGLIVAIDRWVMKSGMKQIVDWYNNGLQPGILSINLAIRQLEQHDFLSYLKTLLDETGCKSEWIELEITESQIMKNPEHAITTLKEISALGIRLAVDDFGTGYSSLSYLKRLPIDKLKIDQSFVRDLPNDEEDASIVDAIIALAKSLRLDTIAEGVETIEQKEFLTQHGCSQIQGYFYAKPMDASQMEKWLLQKGHPQ